MIRFQKPHVNIRYYRTRLTMVKTTFNSFAISTVVAKKEDLKSTLQDLPLLSMGAPESAERGITIQNISR